MQSEMRKPDWKGNFDWRCDKWSEEAVDFCRRKLERQGISHLPGSMTLVQPKGTVREQLASKIIGRNLVPKIVVPRLVPITEGISSAMLRKLVGEPEECSEIAGNLLLNEGIQRLMDMTMIATATGTGWTNALSYIGVGDSLTAEAATQTDLSAATNHFYKAMNATYPSRSSQTSSFQSDFISAEANYAWAEWTISSGATGASGGGFTTGTTNLNRKVQALGTKSTGTWTLTGQITLS